MAVIEPQPIIDAAQPWCCVPQGDLMYAMLAALIDVGEGRTVPTDINDLMEEISCLKCAVQPGDVPLLMLGAIAGITSGGGSGAAGIVGIGSPEGAVVAPVGTSYFDITIPGQVSVWFKRTGAGNTGWEQYIA